MRSIERPYRIIFPAAFLLIALVSPGRPREGALAQAASCPPNSHVNMQKSTPPHYACSCDGGYEYRENSCKPIPTMSAKPQPTMRAMTRAECVRGAGETLKVGLDQCTSSAADCLKNEDVDYKIIECTSAGLGATVTSLLSITDPTQLSKVAAGVTVTGAMATCRSSAKEIASMCSPNWGSCKEDKLKIWKGDIAACPAK